MKIVFFEDGGIMTAPRQCDIRKALAYKMTYDPMRYWFRDCAAWRKACNRYYQLNKLS